MYKKMKKLHLCAAAMAALMCCSMPVMAAGTNYSSKIGGTKTTSFDKYLVMDDEAEVPNVSFTYTVSSGTANSYTVDGKKFEVLAGVDADKVAMPGVGTITKNEITYAPGDETTQDVNAYVKNYDNTKQKYALKTATLDFSACKFTEPGIYRYVLTEYGSNQGVVNDADLTRAIDVYVDDVSDAEGKKLSVTGYVLHSDEDGDPDVSADSERGKSQGFTNVYDTSDLTFRKEVSGNQASRDKYFEFTVKITDAVAGTRYHVALDNADVTSGRNAATIEANAEQDNVAELVVGDDGTVTQKFYLQHGQEITIQGLAAGTKYEVTENAEDYESTAAGVTDYDDAVKSAIANEDVKTSYLNTRNGMIPTGVVMAVSPFVILTLAGGAGAVAFARKKHKSDDSDE